MMNYDYFIRTKIDDFSFDKSWDLFISGFDLNSRVRDVFNNVDAKKKCWIVFPEYGFNPEDLPESGECYLIDRGSESSQLKQFASQTELSKYKDSKVCIDITGFVRPQLLFLLLQLKHIGFRYFDAIYSEPDRYLRREKTLFSSGSVVETRQVQGYFGINKVSKGRDLTIIASGYDKQLLTRVSQFGENSEIVQLIGFPSLKPDMYQENVLQVISASDSFNDSPKSNTLFATAADPFVAAGVVSDYIRDNDCLAQFDNVYISPLSTKAHTLGLGLMHLQEFAQSNVSIIYPFTNGYAKETSVGISNVWMYEIEL